MSDPIIGDLLDLSDELHRVLSLTCVVAMTARKGRDEDEQALAALGVTIEEKFEAAMARLNGIIESHGDRR